MKLMELPSHFKLHLLDQQEHLQHLSLLETAYVVGLDAEWQPNSGGQPKAALIQLAIHTHQSGDHVLLLVSV